MKKTFNFFGLSITIEGTGKNNILKHCNIEEDYITMPYKIAEERYLPEVAKIYTEEEVCNGGRIPAIKSLRDIVQKDLGYMLHLKHAKDLVDQYFRYYK